MDIRLQINRRSAVAAVLTGCFLAVSVLNYLKPFSLTRVRL